MTKKRKSRRETTPKTAQFAKRLRQSMTPAERLLWAHLRRNALKYHFKRQVPVGKFILDFYCAKYKVAVEVDGDIHFEKSIRDIERTNWLKNKKHIRILRVTNREVLDNLAGVINFILVELSSLSPPSPFPPPSSRTLDGGGFGDGILPR